MIQLPNSNSWTPISENSLTDLIEQARQTMSDVEHVLWNAIRLPHADIWQLHPWADEGCGFWVVAVMGNHCIYFNDISGGFAASRFSQWGNIPEFDPQPHSLEQLIGQYSRHQTAPA